MLSARELNGKKKERTTSIDALRFQIPYTPYGHRRLQRQQEKHLNHIRKKLSELVARLSPPCCLWPGQPAGVSPCNALAALGLLPTSPAQTEALPWHKEQGDRGTAKGNLNFCLCKSLLAPTTRPCAKRQPTSSLAICCD